MCACGNRRSVPCVEHDQTASREKADSKEKRGAFPPSRPDMSLPHPSGAPPGLHSTPDQLHQILSRVHFHERGLKKLAATYSRASYTGTTIGNAVFDGRVRNGNGSDHRFIATKKSKRTGSLKTTHRRTLHENRGFSILRSSLTID